MSKICPILNCFDDTDEINIKKCKLCNSKVKFTATSHFNLDKHMLDADDWRVEIVDDDSFRIIWSEEYDALN